MALDAWGKRAAIFRFSKPGILRPIIVAAHGKEIKAYLAKQAAAALGLTMQQLIEEFKKY